MCYYHLQMRQSQFYFPSQEFEVIPAETESVALLDNGSARSFSIATEWKIII